MYKQPGPEYQILYYSNMTSINQPYYLKVIAAK